jgi:TolB protein
VSGHDALGIFDGSTDIGASAASGAASYVDGKYSVTGSGTNMWFSSDEFHFLWKRISSTELTLTAEISFPEAGGDAHRKAAVIVRDSLDPDSAYADIAVHGDGLVSLQYRSRTGEVTREVQSATNGARQVSLIRRGNTIIPLIDGEPAGGSARIEIGDEVYVGLAVCSHDPAALETAEFSNVELSTDSTPGTRLYSTLETIDIASTDRRTVGVFDRWIEAPNWTSDNRLIFNGEGRLYGIPVAGGQETAIDTGSALACNNDHGLSPDGKWIAISDESEGPSIIRVLPVAGGAPRRVTMSSPSYWHGWSPDGATLAYTAKRDDVWGIFSIPVEGGDETRLTTASGLDDGPDYSPDGKHIYFNSDRSGRMQIYRIDADGNGLERVTNDDTADWFPHVSPDGRWLVFVAYDGDVAGHPRDKDVTLQLLDLTDGSVRTIADLFGGQGTMNVPSWSPDSTRLAFVSYSYL